MQKQLIKHHAAGVRERDSLAADTRRVHRPPHAARHPPHASTSAITANEHFSMLLYWARSFHCLRASHGTDCNRP